MSSNTSPLKHIRIIPSKGEKFIHGFPGIPPNANCKHGASIRGVYPRNPCVLTAAAYELALETIYARMELEHSQSLDSRQGEFPFSIPIPVQLPPSVSLDTHGIKIHYSLHATVYRRNMIRFWTNRPLSHSVPIVIQRFDYHPAWPIYHHVEPKHFDNGCIRLFATPERTCYGPGETITVTAELLFGSYRVIPRKIRFDLKLEQTVTLNNECITHAISQTTTRTRLSHHMTTFSSDLACQVPKANIIPTLDSTTTQSRITYVLAVTAEANSQHLRVVVPIIISPWARNSPEVAQEIQRIGPVLSLGGTPSFEAQLASWGSTYAETLVESPPGKLTNSPETKNIEITSEGGELPATLHYKRAFSIGGETLRDENILLDPNHDPAIGIVITDLERRASLTTSISPKINGTSCLAALLHPQRRRATHSSMTIEEEDAILHGLVAPGKLRRDESHCDVRGVIRDLTNILESPENCEALNKLRGDEAQVVVDFLDWALLRMDPAFVWLRKHTLIALYRLCKASHSIPECYALHDITVLAEIESSGGFCDIRKGKYGDQLLCLKVVRHYQSKKRDSDYMMKLFSKEAILWSHLNHPNILPFYGIYCMGKHQKMCLVSPWMDNGHLVNYLQENPSAPRQPFICDVIAGLQYLHDSNIIHGDLKGVNVLVNAEERACITDFGFSSVLIDRSVSQKKATSQTYGGTVRWIAPELFEESEPHPTKASDIWAFGCVCYQISTRLAPFHEYSTDVAVIRRIVDGGLPRRPTANSGTSQLDLIEDELWHLMQRCWSHSPERRLTCNQIMTLLGLEAHRPTDTRRFNERVEFRNAMRNKEHNPIDLAKVDGIFKEVKKAKRNDAANRELVPSNQHL
ncbi:Serine/threonine-protein kinase HT1 [Leucoagaricus sp. SymC.cos]|nr:Serine/threonine-protein kinase HT1 [Leucoagaricus sp. SymC.cos]